MLMPTKALATLTLLIMSTSLIAKEATNQYAREQSIDIKQLFAIHPDAKTLWGSLTDNFVDAYYAQNYVAAQQLAMQNLQLAKDHFGEFHLTTADSHNKLAIASEALGEYNQADRHYAIAQQILIQQLGSNHPSVAEVLNNRANIHIINQDYRQAEAMHQHSLQIRTTSWGEAHPDVAETLYNLAYLSNLMGESNEAINHYRKAIQTWRSLSTPQHQHIADALTNLANIYIEKKQWENAQRVQLKALLIRQQHLPQNIEDIAQSYLNLGNIATKMERFDEATLLFLEGLEQLESVLEKDDPTIAIALYYLANAYHQQANQARDKQSSQEGYAAAEPLYQRALSIWRSSHGEHYPNLGVIFSELALLYREMGRTEEAGRMQQQAQLLNP